MKLLLRGWPTVALKTNAMFHKRRVSSAQFMAANAQADPQRRALADMETNPLGSGKPVAHWKHRPMMPGSDPAAVAT